VNTGAAAVGVLGAVGGRTFTVIGDAVNVAARLEGQAPVGGVAIGGETLRSLTGATTESLGRLQVKGREEPVDAYRLLALTADSGHERRDGPSPERRGVPPQP
jgi:class 3 adenylate cyclase